MAAAALAIGPSTAAAATTVKASADTYVREGTTSDYGKSTSVKVDGSPRTYTFIRFSVPTFSGTVNKATLRVYAKDTLAGGVDARPVGDTGWSETKMTFTNAPAMGAVAASSGAIGGAGWIGLDVSRLVTTSGKVAFALTTQDSHSVSLSSRDAGSSKAPQLVIDIKQLDATPPAVPTGLVASAGDGSVRLDWAANTDADLATYRVHRRIAAGAWELIAPPAGGVLPVAGYVDGATTNDVTYEYRLTAVDKAGNESAASTAVTARPTDLTPPAAPTGLAIIPGDTKIDLRWSSNTEGDVANYRVYRRVAGGTWSSTSIASPVAPAITDAALSNGTTYEYRVAAVDTHGNESAASSPLTATPGDRTAPAPPTGLTAGAGNGKAELTWARSPEADVAGYRLYRLDAGGTWPVAPVGSTTLTTLTDSGLTNGAKYEYRVTAVDTAGNESGPSLTATATPQASDPRTGTGGIWLSSSQIAALPTSGPAWDRLKAAADSSLGTAKISDQESNHDVLTLAAALVWARTSDASYRAKAATGIAAAIGTEVGGRTLALGRNLLAYVLAADLVELGGYDAALDSRFRSWLSAVRTEVLDSRTLINTHEDRPNNWGAMAGASRMGADLYLGDQADFARAAMVFRGWLGDRNAYAAFKYDSDLSWQANASAPVGINPVGATIQGFSVDGALPEELRRGCSFQIPPCHTGYVWEAMQGGVAQAQMLARQGYDAWNWSDRALLRAGQFILRLDQLYGGWWVSTDDGWVPWALNRAYATAFPTLPVTTQGKLMGWTDWMFG